MFVFFFDVGNLFGCFVLVKICDEYYMFVLEKVVGVYIVQDKVGIVVFVQVCGFNNLLLFVCIGQYFFLKIVIFVV